MREKRWQLWVMVCLVVFVFMAGGCSSSGGSSSNGNGESPTTPPGTNPPTSSTTLKSLLLSTGTLSPDFQSDVLKYTASVANATTSITVTPTASSSDAKITVNDSEVASGNTSSPISLDVGTNTITIVVANSSDSMSYIITATRADTKTTPNPDPEDAIEGGQTEATTAEGKIIEAALKQALPPAGESISIGQYYKNIVDYLKGHADVDSVQEFQDSDSSINRTIEIHFKSNIVEFLIFKENDGTFGSGSTSTISRFVASTQSTFMPTLSRQPEENRYLFLAATNKLVNTIGMSPFRASIVSDGWFDPSASICLYVNDLDKQEKLTIDSAFISDSNVTIGLLKDLHDYDFVHITTHGAMTSYGPSLILMEQYSDSYREDDNARRLARAYFFTFNGTPQHIDFTGTRTWIKGNSLVVHPSFFTHHYKTRQLNKPLIYLSVCHGLETPTLGNALIQAGARTVMGYDAAVTSRYAHETGLATIKELVEGKTVTEAMREATQDLSLDPYIDAEKYGKRAKYIFVGTDTNRLVINKDVLVVDEDNKPVSGIKITLKRNSTTATGSAKCTSDMNGTAKILLPASVYDISAFKADGSQLTITQPKREVKENEDKIIIQITQVEEKLTIEPSSLNLKIGDVSTPLLVKYDDTTVQASEWKSSDSNVATVSEGKVTAISPGTVTIIASFLNKNNETLKAFCIINVTNENKSNIVDESFLSGKWIITSGKYNDLSNNEMNICLITSTNPRYTQIDGNGDGLQFSFSITHHIFTSEWTALNTSPNIYDHYVYYNSEFPNIHYSPADPTFSPQYTIQYGNGPVIATYKWDLTNYDINDGSLYFDEHLIETKTLTRVDDDILRVSHVRDYFSNFKGNIQKTYSEKSTIFKRIP